MTLNKNIITKSRIYLILFIISCLATFYTIAISNLNLTLLVITVKYLVLMFYYVSIVKKNNYYLIVTLVLFYIASVFFTYSHTSIYGIITLVFCRLLLIQLTLSNLKAKSINWEIFLTVCSLLLVIMLVILSLSNNSTLFFYLALIASSFLIVLLSLSFLNLLNTTKRGNLLFFSAISLFVISDSISGAQRFTQVSQGFIVLASVLYNGAYFLIVKSEIDRETLLRR